MKTIKELEAYEGEHYEEGYNDCRNRVLKLIDEGCGQYDSIHPELTRCCGDILFSNKIWLCQRCEELKARITGDKQKI